MHKSDNKYYRSLSVKSALFSYPQCPLTGVADFFLEKSAAYQTIRHLLFTKMREWKILSLKAPKLSKKADVSQKQSLIWLFFKQILSLQEIGVKKEKYYFPLVACFI